MRLPFVVLCALVAASMSLAAASPSLASETAPEGPPTIVDVSGRPLPPIDAPADEYFGRLKLSNLGIRNVIHALAVEGNSPLALPMQRTRIMGVHTAIVDWANRFPQDPWLRRVVLNFTDVIAQKHDVDTDRIAVDLLLQETQRLGNTPYAKVALARANAIVPASDIDWSVVPFDMPSLLDTAELHARI